MFYPVDDLRDHLHRSMFMSGNRNHIDTALSRDHLQGGSGLQTASHERFSTWRIFHQSCGPVCGYHKANHTKQLKQSFEE